MGSVTPTNPTAPDAPNEILLEKRNDLKDHQELKDNIIIDLTNPKD